MWKANGRTTDAYPWQKRTWPMARWAKKKTKKNQTHIYSPCGLLFGKRLLLQPPHWNATFILCSWSIFLIFRSVYRWKTTMMTTSTTTDPSHTSTKKDKKTDNGWQNATQKSKDWPTGILIKKKKSTKYGKQGAPEGEVDEKQE